MTREAYPDIRHIHYPGGLWQFTVPDCDSARNLFEGVTGTNTASMNKHIIDVHVMRPRTLRMNGILFDTEFAQIAGLDLTQAGRILAGCIDISRVAGENSALARARLHARHERIRGSNPDEADRRFNETLAALTASDIAPSALACLLRHEVVDTTALSGYAIEAANAATFQPDVHDSFIEPFDAQLID